MSRAIGVVLLVGVVLLSALYFVRANGAPPASARPNQPGAPLSVVVEPAARMDIRRSLTLIGTVKAVNQAILSAKVPSRIAQVYVRNGDRVAAGQVLVRLDVGDTTALTAGADAGVKAARAQYLKAVEGKAARATEIADLVNQAEAGVRLARAKLRQAELGVRLTDSAAISDRDRAASAVTQAESGVRQAEIGYKQASETLRRLGYVYDRGGVAKADLDGARTQADIAGEALETARAGLAQARAAAKPAAETAPLRTQVSEADVESARAGVAQAEGGLKTARKGQISALRIADEDIAAAKAMVEQARVGGIQARAQVGGSTLTAPIAGIATEVGARAGEYAQPGMPLAVVVAPGSVQIEVAVPARYASLIAPGMTARVVPDEAGVKPMSGRVSEIVPVANADNRSFTLRVAVEPRGAKPAPETMAMVTIRVAGPPRALSIPLDAVRSEGDDTFAWVSVAGRASRRRLELGVRNGERVEVVAGLRPGDAVIVSASSELAEGSAVRIAAR